MAPKTLQVHPSLFGGTGGVGTSGAVVDSATLAGRRLQTKSPGAETYKISNNPGTGTPPPSVAVTGRRREGVIRGKEPPGRSPGGKAPGTSSGLTDCLRRRQQSPRERTRRPRTGTSRPEPTTRAPAKTRPRRAPQGAGTRRVARPMTPRPRRLPWGARTWRERLYPQPKPTARAPTETSQCSPRAVHRRRAAVAATLPPSCRRAVRRCRAALNATPPPSCRRAERRCSAAVGATPPPSCRRAVRRCGAAVAATPSPSCRRAVRR
jgi:hypothetical protein